MVVMISIFMFMTDAIQVGTEKELLFLAVVATLQACKPETTISGPQPFQACNYL